MSESTWQEECPDTDEDWSECLVFHFSEEREEIAWKRESTLFEYADEMEPEYDHDESSRQAEDGRKHEAHAKCFTDESEHPAQHRKPDESPCMEEHEWFPVFLVVLCDFCRQRENESAYDSETAREGSDYTDQHSSNGSHPPADPEIQDTRFLQQDEKPEQQKTDRDGLPYDCVIILFPFGFFYGQQVSL